MTYMLNGSQYIVVADRRGSVTGEYVAFALPAASTRPAGATGESAMSTRRKKPQAEVTTSELTRSRDARSSEAAGAAIVVTAAIAGADAQTAPAAAPAIVADRVRAADAPFA